MTCCRCMKINTIWAIIDPEIEIDISASVRWEVLSWIDKINVWIDSGLSSMSDVRVLLVSVIMAYDHLTKVTILLGEGIDGWNKDLNQTDLLFNSHDL